MNLVSVIVPVYNAEKYLNACIESIQNQSYENIEIILVNDGSSDDSQRICDEYQKRDRRIKAYHRENYGVSATRNYGIEHAAGKYIMFVDADDTIEADTVKDNLELAEKNQADLVIYCFKYIITEENRTEPNEQERSFAGKAGEFFEQYFDVMIDHELLNPPWNKFIRKELIDKNNIRFNVNFSICEDMAFSTQVLAASNNIVLNHKMYYNYFLKSSGTLVFKYYNNYFEALTNFYTEALKYCMKFQNNKQQIDKLDSLYANLTMMYIKQICQKKEWEEGQKMVRLREVAENPRFTNALHSSSLNASKRILKILLKNHCYHMINCIYAFK